MLLTFGQVLQHRITAKIKQELLTYVQELSELIHGPSISIKEEIFPTCPNCGTRTNSRPDGVLWECLSCDEKFTDAKAIPGKELRVRTVGEDDNVMISCYNDTDLQRRIVALSPFLTPIAIFHLDKVLYINIVHRYGSLEKGFASVGMIYANPALEEWQITIIDFLGVLPDGQIAKIIGKHTQNIREYRVRLGISSASENLLGVAITREAVDEIRKTNKEVLSNFYQDFSNKKWRDFRKMAKKIIGENSDKTDEDITSILAGHGIKIARRTVNKYRGQIKNEATLLSRTN